MELELIKQKIANDIGVRRLPVPKLDNIQFAVKYFCEIADEFLKKKEKQFSYDPVKNQVESLIRWAYMIGDDLDFTKGILFKGNTGRGKTFLFRVFEYFAKIDSLLYVENGVQLPISVKIVNVKKISGEYQAPSGGYPVILRYAGYRCLVIDDIGKEQEKSANYGNKLNIVEEIINIREEWGMLTFGTTNLNRMEDAYDDRTISRMNNLFNVLTLNHDCDFRGE